MRSILLNFRILSDAYTVHRQYTRLFEKHEIYSFLFDEIIGLVFLITLSIERLSVR